MIGAGQQRQELGMGRRRGMGMARAIAMARAKEGARPREPKGEAEEACNLLDKNETISVLDQGGHMHGSC